MGVIFSDSSWESFKRDWQRMRRELLDKVNLALRRVESHEQKLGAPFYPILFRNESGETIPAFGVMRITGAEYLGSIPVITVGKPNSTFQRQYLVNGPLPVSGSSNQDRRGFGTWADQSAFVLYDDANTPAYGEEWGPSNGSWKIKKYRYGFHILGGATGGDTDLVGCRQTVVNQFLFKAHDGDIASGSSGTATIYDGNEATTSDTISVKNRTGIIITDETWGRGVWLGSKWFGEPWECPA